MLVFADSYGSHYVNHRDLNNPKNNRQMNKTFKMRLKKNGHDFADVAVNDNGKYYYRKFNNLQNFFQKLNDNDNSIFQLAKNNNRKISRKKYYKSLSNTISQTHVPHIQLIKNPSNKITSITYNPKSKKPVAKKPVAKKPVAKKPVAKKPVAKKPPTKKRALKKK